jgi:hypothetical protein
MLAAVLFSAHLRVTGTADYAADFAYVSDFGWYAGGHLNLTWSAPASAGRIVTNLLLLERSAYEAWYLEQHSAGSWRACADPSPAYANWTAVLAPAPQHRAFAVNSSGVFIAVVQHCLARFAGRYSIDAEFANPGGQQLDSREIPALTVLPVAIAVCCAFLENREHRFRNQSRT